MGRGELGGDERVAGVDALACALIEAAVSGAPLLWPWKKTLVDLVALSPGSVLLAREFAAGAAAGEFEGDVVG